MTARPAVRPALNEDDPLPPLDRLSPADAQRPLDDLYRSHSRALVAALVRRTGCREIARDLAHEAFARFLRLTPLQRRRIDRPEAYLHRISANLLADWGRSRMLHRSTLDLLAPTYGSEIDQVTALESRDTVRRLEQAMARLKPKTRQIFMAHRLDGMSYAEIAERTGLSVSGVEKQMIKAIAKIDRFLDRC